MRTATGIVIWFNPKRGFGFIKPDDGGPDIFAQSQRGGRVHFAEGDRVEYELQTWGKPPRTEVFIRFTAPSRRHIKTYRR